MLPKVPQLNFESSGDARAKKRVQSHLLSRIQEASEEMAGGDVGDEFSFIHPSRELQPTRLKRPRYLEADTTYKL